MFPPLDSVYKKYFDCFQQNNKGFLSVEEKVVGKLGYRKRESILRFIFIKRKYFSNKNQQKVCNFTPWIMWQEYTLPKFRNTFRNRRLFRKVVWKNCFSSTIWQWPSVENVGMIYVFLLKAFEKPLWNIDVI